jgi:hypothetical protein
MICRTWPYGTMKPGKVVEAFREGRIETIIFEADDSPKEAFVLIDGKVTILPKAGDRGIITFMEGGPTGGYWRYSPVAAS